MSNSNPGDDGSLYDPPRGTSPPEVIPSPPSTTVASETSIQCYQFDVNYEIIDSVFCAILCVSAIVYIYFGYRYFRTTMFCTGFLFASVLTFFICKEEDLLPIEGKIGVAIAAGVLYGLTTMLVQYIGLFMTGLHSGLLAGIAGLIFSDQMYHSETKWLPISILFACGVFFGVIILYTQRVSTVLGTAIFGSFLLLVGVDYFTEHYRLVFYIWAVVKSEVTTDYKLCWYSWIVLSLWPLGYFSGFIIQFAITAKGFDHQQMVPRRHRRAKTVHLERVRTQERRETPNNQYRHLYQVRRSNGDVISQNYIQGIQNRLSPAVREIAHHTHVDPQPTHVLETVQINR